MGQALKMADRFLADGVIIIERGAHHRPVEHPATSRDTITDWPIVVLIDEHSASASEIVAGALACHQRAVLVGTRSFGKATMQKTYPIAAPGGDGLLKLTTAYLYLKKPGGTEININRIAPPSDLTRPSAQPLKDRHQDRGGIQPALEVALTEEQLGRVLQWRRALDVFYPNGEPTTRPDDSTTTQPADHTTTAPDMTPDELASALLADDQQLAAAVAVLEDPARYRELLPWPPPTTQPDDSK
jgi:C-terminal processing protease CtpA/Prc